MGTPRCWMREMEQNSILDALISRMHRILSELEVEQQKGFLHEVAVGALEMLRDGGHHESLEKVSGKFLEEVRDAVTIGGVKHGVFLARWNEQNFLLAKFLERTIGELILEYQRPYNTQSFEEPQAMLGGEPMEELPEQEWQERLTAMERLAETIRK